MKTLFRDHVKHFFFYNRHTIYNATDLNTELKNTPDNFLQPLPCMGVIATQDL